MCNVGLDNYISISFSLLTISEMYLNIVVILQWLMCTHNLKFGHHLLKSSEAIQCFRLGTTDQKVIVPLLNKLDDGVRELITLMKN